MRLSEQDHQALAVAVSTGCGCAPDGLCRDCAIPLPEVIRAVEEIVSGAEDLAWVRGYEQGIQAPSKTAEVAVEAFRERAAMAIHVQRFAKRQGTLTGPDNYYNGAIRAESIVRNLGAS